MSAMIFNGGPHTRLRHAPQYFVTDLPAFPDYRPDPLYVLNYFKITPAMLIDYMMATWPLFVSQENDVIYEYMVQEIESGVGIFRKPVEDENDDTYFNLFEALMEIIYSYRDHFKRVLINQIDVNDESDQTQFFCTKAEDPGTVVLGVQKEFVY